MADGLRGIWRLLTQTGLINLDFADLCSVTRGRHVASSFATAEAGGEKRGEQVLEKLLPIRCWTAARSSTNPTPSWSAWPAAPI
jgi:cell division GTPase FtsZ